jgi:transcriptional regulator with XRE-family HTH domain
MDTNPDGHAPSPNRGAALLRHYLAARSTTLAALSAALGVSSRTAQRWLRGTMPEGPARYAVAGLTGGHVPPEAWDSRDVADIDESTAALRAERAS